MGPARIRIIDWISRPHVRDASPPLTDAQTVAASRARLSARAACAALSDEPPSATRDALACDLFRQAVYWAVCALSGDPPPASGEYRDEVWKALESDDLRAAVSQAARAELLRTHLGLGSLAHFEALVAAERRAVRTELEELAKLLLRRLNARQDPMREVRRWWTVRGVAIATVMLAFYSLLAFLQSRDDARRDLAAGRPWRASSEFGGGCTSPEQDCDENTGFFFHTAKADASPFVEFDLGSVQRVSTVVVKNRMDCCTERAVPLFVEVAVSPGAWHRVAARQDVFSTWRATFRPMDARWVRLLREGTAPFHLYRVQILR